MRLETRHGIDNTFTYYHQDSVCNTTCSETHAGQGTQVKQKFEKNKLKTETEKGIRGQAVSKQDLRNKPYLQN